MTTPTPVHFEIRRHGMLVHSEAIEADVIKIGTDPRSTIAIDDPAASRVHAMIERRGDTWVLFDLGTGRGTFVDGCRITRHVLSEGATIRIGDTDIVFSRAVALAEDDLLEVVEDEPLRPSDEVLYARRFLSRPLRADATVDVAVLYNDHVQLDTQLSTPARFTVGQSEACDVQVEHDSIPVDVFSVIEMDGDQPVLRFTPHMDGEVFVGTTRMTFAEACARYASTMRAGICNLPLTAETRARFRFGEMTLFARRGHRADLKLPGGLFANVSPGFVGISALIHALLMALVFLFPQDLEQVHMETFNPENRFVSTLIQPIETPPVEVPPIEPDTSTDPTADGSDATSDGTDNGGGGGAATDQHSDGGGDGTETSRPGRHTAHREATDYGVVAVMAQLGGMPAFGDDPNAMPDDFIAVATDGGFDYGLHQGLADLGGLVGPGGGRGPVGPGPFTIGGHGPGGGDPPPPTFTERTENDISVVVDGTIEVGPQLSLEQVRRVIREHRREIRACYESELQRNPDLEGRIMLDFVIDPTGAVASASVSESNLGSDAVESCVVRRIRRWRFPLPSGGGIVRVSYPYVFTGGN